MGNLSFDATSIKPADAFDPIPPGWYACTITKADVIQHATAGGALKLEFEVIGEQHPQFANRKLWANLFISHPNSQQAREIAQRALSSICHSVGKLQVADSEELLGTALRVKVDVQPPRTGTDGKTYEARNECKGYKPLEEKKEAAAPKPAAKPAASAPWKR